MEGAAPPTTNLKPSVWLRRITPRYFNAMGLQIVSGRTFTSSDGSESALVTLVNETLERDYFDGRAVGRRPNVNSSDDPVCREIVGVVRDIKNFGIGAASRNAMCLPYSQFLTS